MVDHVRTLLVNPPTGSGYVHVSDEPADAVMGMVGLTGTYLDAALVDRVLSLAMAPDLEWARDVFDQRVTPPASGSSVYRFRYDVTGDDGTTLSLSLDGLHDRLLGKDAWWRTSALFSHPDPLVQQRLDDLRDAAMSMDSAYAVGAVLLACAYRRHLLQEASL